MALKALLMKNTEGLYSTTVLERNRIIWSLAAILRNYSVIIYHICQTKIFVRTVGVSTVDIGSKINQKVQ